MEIYDNSTTYLISSIIETSSNTRFRASDVDGFMDRDVLPKTTITINYGWRRSIGPSSIQVYVTSNRRMLRGIFDIFLEIYYYYVVSARVES